jgi:hypothetical protein
MSARRGFALPLIIIAILLPIILLVAWSPWVSVDFGIVDNKISQSLKKPCELFYPPFSDTAGMPLPPKKTLFGVISHYEYVKCGPGKTFIEQYFVSFLGTVHKISSKTFEYKQDQNSNKAAENAENETSQTTNFDSIGANWKTYTNKKYNFSFKYPPDTSLVETTYNAGESTDVAEIDNQIVLNVSNLNSEDCRGDCAFIETTSPIKVNNLNARKLTGSIGGIGGGSPQNYQTVSFNHNNLYYDFTLYELKLDYDPLDPNREPVPISQDKLKLLDQILSTFKFLN